jgi:hypothetical protein
MNEKTKENFLRNSMTASAAAIADGGTTNSADAPLRSGLGPSGGSSTRVSENAIPNAALTSIADLLDRTLYVKAGHKVLVVAYLDGLYGGDNLVDRDAIHWIAQELESRGAIPEVLWVDAPAHMHAWEFPDAVREAMARNDRMIYHSFDLVVEEIIAFRKHIYEFVRTPTKPGNNITAVRNMATTGPLLCTEWAQTPYELVSEIRHQAGKRIQALVGEKWELTDPLGTRLSGVILPCTSGFGSYDARRERRTQTPWPEWVVPPIHLSETSGTFVFDRTLSWWSRYIGISPYFERPVQLVIQNNKIVSIEGGSEADAIRRFLKDIEGRTAGGVYDFDQMHFGVHPQAHVAEHQCPSVLYRRLIEHCHTSNFHVHVGSPIATQDYPYWPHITGDIRHPTFRIEDTLIHDAGRLTVLDDPAVKAVADRYPGRPGLDREPFHG